MIEVVCFLKKVDPIAHLFTELEKLEVNKKCIETKKIIKKENGT